MLLLPPHHAAAATSSCCCCPLPATPPHLHATCLSGLESAISKKVKGKEERGRGHVVIEGSGHGQTIENDTDFIGALDLYRVS
jgi:hypothetical protein